MSSCEIAIAEAEHIVRFGYGHVSMADAPAGHCLAVHGRKVLVKASVHLQQVPKLYA